MGERISFFVGMCFVTVTEAYSLRRVLNVVVYHFYYPLNRPPQLPNKFQCIAIYFIVSHENNKACHT